MNNQISVAVIVGSLRAASYSRKIAKALIERAPASLACRIVEIGDLPLYNEDLDAEPPAAWTRFRDEVRKSGAVLFVTPEYNRSIPGCLKNAVDVGSRPEGKSVFDGMPAGVVSVTPYNLGAFGANHALRQTFAFLNMPVMQQPEAYIGRVAELLGDDGSLKDGKTDGFLTNFAAQFGKWVQTVRGASPQDFDAFMKRRDEIAEAFVNGEAAPLEAIVVRHDPASFFSPGGDHQQGAASIAARYEEDSRSFAKPGRSELEVLQSAASGELAFWTGLQHAEARMGDKPPQQMTLRVTEVFRFEDGDWKLAHRHADQAKA
ncbi:MAG TPA: NAD(P)H-dependent oxidoreductase [Caulobacteraceae bacterium]